MFAFFRVRRRPTLAPRAEKLRQQLRALAAQHLAANGRYGYLGVKMKKNIIFAALMIVCVAMIIGWYFFDCELFALFNSLPSDTSRLGVVVFVCAFWMPIWCYCNILIDKEDVQQAIEFLRIKNKLDPVYE
ncbi:MAG: hypothetical protein IKU14_10570, partial [Rhodocyclaceae bacterium]|nr:hypothetical protein [Rhodocyclaceae bacterium]